MPGQEPFYETKTVEQFRESAQLLAFICVDLAWNCAIS